MGFSKFRLPFSSRDPQGEVGQSKDPPIQGKSPSPSHIGDHTRANNLESAGSPNLTQGKRDAGQVQRLPKKLQPSPSRQQMNPYANAGFNGHHMHQNYQQASPYPHPGNQQYMGNGLPQYQPGFGAPPPHPGYTAPPHQYPPPVLVQEPPTPAMESVRKWPKHPMPVPPMPSPFQISQGHVMPPWTPNHPPIEYWDQRGSSAVPTYELPPPDLLDYDMSYLIAFRMMPEWNKNKEDSHWEQVRRARNDYLRRQWGQEKESCTVM
ncbi:MAG: hypothetical protein Q9166_003032 [cf. Caloplaca sp. 2 TL-2023]